MQKGFDKDKVFISYNDEKDKQQAYGKYSVLDIKDLYRGDF